MAYKTGDNIRGYAPSFLPSLYLFHLCLFAVRLIDWFVFRLKVKGRENLHLVDRAVLVSNHTLVVDPGVIAHVVRPRRTYFTMLEETALIPYLGTFVRLLGAIPIPPNSMQELEDGLVAALGKTGLVHVFPEGECYLWNQQIRRFHSGAFYLACRMRVPVVPVTTVLHERRLFGKTSFQLSHRLTLRVPPRVSVVIGTPLFPDRFLAETTRLRSAARLMGESARRQMQEAIDREGGSKTLDRGMMPRMFGQDDEARAQGA